MFEIGKLDAPDLVLVKSLAWRLHRLTIHFLGEIKISECDDALGIFFERACFHEIDEARGLRTDDSNSLTWRQLLASPLTKHH